MLKVKYSFLKLIFKVFFINNNQSQINADNIFLFLLLKNDENILNNFLNRFVKYIAPHFAKNAFLYFLVSFLFL